MDIDVNMIGAESVASKANNLAKSMGRLESSWSKYNRSISSGKMGGGGFFKNIKGGGSGAVGLIQGAAAFVTVQKIMEKLMGDKVKEWSANLIKEDLKRWKAIGSGVAKFISPMTQNIAANMKLLQMGMSQMLKGAAKGLKDIISQANFPALFAGAGKLGNRIKKSMGIAYVEGKIIGKIFGTSLRQILSKTPISLLIGLPLLTAALDERVSKWLNEKIEWAIEKVTTGVTNIINGVGYLWSGFKMGLARATNNAYYTGSQVNRDAALKNITPSQQTNYINSEIKRLQDEDLEEFVIRTKKELIELFESENKKRNEEIRGIQEIMISQGRL